MAVAVSTIDEQLTEIIIGAAMKLPFSQFQTCQASDQTRLQLRPPILFIRASPCLPWLNFFREFSRRIHPLGDLGSLAYSFITRLY
jgi:hypothetical protein